MPLTTHAPVRSAPPPHPAGSHFGDDWPSAACIHEPETNLAVIRRAPLEIPGTLAELARHREEFAQLALDRGAPPELLPALFDEDLNLQSADSALFYADLQATAERFLELTRAQTIGVRLERVEGDSCRLFHVDHLALRLLTTYQGPGTEWLANEDVMRPGLGRGDDALVRRPGARVRSLERGWIALLKGERYPDNRGRGLVHRSPSIAGTGTVRFVLRMDTLA